MRIQVETMTCLALAGLWDDPENNNFDCPWQWRRGATDAQQG